MQTERELLTRGTWVSNVSVGVQGMMPIPITGDRIQSNRMSRPWLHVPLHDYRAATLSRRRLRTLPRRSSGPLRRARWSCRVMVPMAEVMSFRVPAESTDCGRRDRIRHSLGGFQLGCSLDSEDLNLYRNPDPNEGSTILRVDCPTSLQLHPPERLMRQVSICRGFCLSPNCRTATR
jgi:hypothetical protein